ncbi:unnamed protein product [Ectocarpus fasciculatus]
MRMSQWSAALQSVKAGAGVEAFKWNFGFNGDIHENVNPATLVPQMVTIPPEHCHWIEVPRVGAGVRSSRKTVVFIVTESNDENDGRRMRLEADIHLRSKTMLKVKLRVSEEGKVIGSPAASESGGILSQVLRLIQNQVNADPHNAPSTARSCSETNSVANGVGAADDAAAVTTPTAIAAEAAATVSVATVPEDRELPAAKNAVDDATAGARARVQPNASPCSPAMSAVADSPVA